MGAEARAEVGGEGAGQARREEGEDMDGIMAGMPALGRKRKGSTKRGRKR